MFSYLLLTLGSLAAFGLILLHSIRSYGGRETILFLAASWLYGILRHLLVWWVTISYHQSAFPYQFIHTPLKIFGISPQELIGWSIMAYLGWHMGSLFFKRINLFTASLGTFLVIASFSLAIETTAIDVHWWFWRVTTAETLFGKAPLLGIMDWGFVGLEFAAPYFLWRKKGKLAYLAALSILPLIHFPVHTLLTVPSFLPFTLNEGIHYGVLFILLMGGTLLPSVDERKPIERPGLIAAASGVILLVLLTVQLVEIKTLSLLYFLLPAGWFTAALIKPEMGWFSLLQAPLIPLKRLFLPGAIPGLVRAFFSLPHRGVQRLLLILLLALFLLGMFQTKERFQAFEQIYKQANVAYNRGNFPEAERLLERALSLSKRSYQAWFYLGNALRKQGKWRRAVEAYRESLSRLEFNGPASTWLITSHLMLNEPSRAKEVLDRLMKIYPYEPTLLYLAGNTEHRLGNEEAARRYWQSYLYRSQGEKDPLMTAQCYLNLGEKRKATDYAERYLTKNPKDWETAAWLERIYLSLGDEESAFALYHRLAKLYPMRSYILKVAEFGAKRGHVEQAREALLTILKHEPDNVQARELLKSLE